jgi:WD40 repeat protein
MKTFFRKWKAPLLSFLVLFLLRSMFAHRLHGVSEFIALSALILILFGTAYYKKKFSFVFSVGLLTIIVTRLLFGSIETFENRSSYQSCHAPCKNGDCDGYVSYAQWILGETISWDESHTFRQTANYNPYLTRIALANAPHGNFFVSAGGDGLIKFWNWNGKLLQTLTSNQQHLTSIAFFPDGKSFVTGGWDGTFHQYSFEGKLLKSINAGQMAVTALAISPNGRLLATGGWDGTVRFWSYDVRPLTEALWNHEATISDLAFSPNNKILASSSYDWSIKIWDVKGQFLSTPIVDRFWPLEGVSFSRDGRLWAAGEDIYVHVCTPKSEFKIWACVNKYGDKRVAYIKAVPRSDMQQVLTGSNDPIAYLFDKGGTSIDLKSSQTGEITSVIYSGDESKVAAASRDGTIQLWGSRGQPIGTPISAHYMLKPKIRFLGIPDHGRQAGMPFLISLYMRLVGVKNTCAVKTMQPLILGLLLLCGFLISINKLGSVLTIGLLLPFLDPDNYFAFYSLRDFTEFTLATFLPIIVILLYLGIFGKKKKTQFLIIACVLAFLIAQVKILIFVFLLQVLIALSLTIVLARIFKSQWIKGLDLKQVTIQILLLGVVFVGLTVAVMKIYPEAFTANERLTFMRYLPIPVKESMDPLLEKFRRFQKVAFRRTERYAALTPYRVGFDSINYEFTLMNRDEHAVTDPQTKEVFYFSEKDIKTIGYKLLLANPKYFLIFGTQQVRASWNATFLYSPFVEGSKIYKLIWVFCLGLGMYSLFATFGWLAFSGLLSVVFFFIYFTYFFIFEMRYWMTFSSYYYVAFAFGFAFIIEKCSRAIEKKRHSN